MLYHEPRIIKKITLIISVEKMNILIKLRLDITSSQYKKNSTKNAKYFKYN